MFCPIAGPFISIVILQFPEHGFYGLVDKILLFKHELSSDNVLVALTSADDVNEGCLIEIVLSGEPSSLVARGHALPFFSVVGITGGFTKLFIF